MRAIDAHTAQISDQIACPAVDILFLHQLAHALHSCSSFFRCHLQRVADSICRPFNVVRVNENSVDEFTGGAGEPAQQQHPLFVVTCSYELLCDQVHPVMQRCHQAKIGCTIVTRNLLMAVVPFQEDNRPPLATLEPPVDSVRLGFDIGEQVMIALNVRATGSNNLDKSKLSLIIRMFLEHAFNCQKTLDDSFCVIHTIHPDTKKQCLNPQFAEKCDAIQIRRLCIVEPNRRFGEFHTDREGLDDCAVPGAIHRKVFPIDARFESSVNCVQEVRAVSLHVEPNQIGSQHSAQQFSLPWANSKSSRARPRNVPEDRNPSVGAFFLDQSREQRKVVILHEYYRRVGSRHLLQYCPRELLVCCFVTSPIRCAEDESRMSNVTQWQQTFGGQA